MLIFISDLHFVDGTAGEHNVPTDAFKIFFEDIAGNVDWILKDGRKVEEIKIVFLGDIFDLLRTEMWFAFPEDERPWGDNEARIEQNALAVFDALIKKNKETFDLLQASLKDEYGLPVELERTYIPGNHDRLCNKYDSLRSRVCNYLKLRHDSSIPFEHYFEDVNYGVFARHGHEYDKYNYEDGISHRHHDYMRVPIGDPITTELVAKLPYTLMKKIDSVPLDPEEKERIKRNFQEIENVRPLSAIIDWLLYQVKKDLKLKEIIEQSVDEVIREFNELEFVKRWYKHHDKWHDWWDEADKIQSVLFLLEKFKVFPSEKLLPLLKNVRDRFSKDDLLEAAPQEYSYLDNRIRYVVYGHTHEPLQVPIRVVERPTGSIEHVYLNTGTWRTRHHKSQEGLGFISWKNLTYNVFYRREERGTDFPTFETWTGTLKTV